MVEMQFRKIRLNDLDMLVAKSRKAGMQVENVIGDKAYSSKDNIESAEKNQYQLIAN